jgi:hypothetical protein
MCGWSFIGAIYEANGRIKDAYMCYAAELRDNMKCPLFLQSLTPTASTASVSSISIPPSSVLGRKETKTSSAHIVHDDDDGEGDDANDDDLESTISIDSDWRSQITDVRSFAAYKCALYHKHAPPVTTVDEADQGDDDDDHDTVSVTSSIKRANELCKWALQVAPQHCHWILSLQVELGTPDGQELIGDCVFNDDWMHNTIKIVAKAKCMSRTESDEKSNQQWKNGRENDYNDGEKDDNEGDDNDEDNDIDDEILSEVRRLRQIVATMKYYIAKSLTDVNRMNGIPSIIGWRRTSTIDDTFDPFAYYYFMKAMEGSSYEGRNQFYEPIVSDLIRYMNEHLHEHRSVSRSNRLEI